ncbi:adhesive plaque matrix protein-like [Pollicipes pollicipes]|uniref:adhesive plaque matrix protein-like n=1 Tax=Pollicipes pollicipes TaxID=41117 RepID=UPI001884D2D4|nr:adhesive plaque matrix protein-like [Pollicipes pollicipes]
MTEPFPNRFQCPIAGTASVLDVPVFVVVAVLAVAAAAQAPDSPSYHSALSYKPAPYHPESQYKEEAEPFAYDYAPYKPAPAPYKPAPAPYKPAPAPYRPAPSYKPAPYHPEPQYKEEARPYAFDYAVNDHYTGTNFAQKEESDGHNTQGYYSVALPDGRVQHVKYVADHYGGYNAEVTYEGEATFPEYHPAPAYKAAAPAYKAAAPAYKPTYSHPAPAYKAAAPAYRAAAPAYKAAAPAYRAAAPAYKAAAPAYKAAAPAYRAAAPAYTSPTNAPTLIGPSRRYTLRQEPAYEPSLDRSAVVKQPILYDSEPQYNGQPKSYAYDYIVNDQYSGAYFSQKEESDGHSTQGYYTVALPDGRIQHVKYIADSEGGYNAEVTYEDSVSSRLDLAAPENPPGVAEPNPVEYPRDAAYSPPASYRASTAYEPSP